MLMISLTDDGKGREITSNLYTGWRSLTIASNTANYKSSNNNKKKKLTETIFSQQKIAKSYYIMPALKRCIVVALCIFFLLYMNKWYLL